MSIRSASRLNLRNKNGSILLQVMQVFSIISMLEFLNNLWGLGTISNRDILPACRAHIIKRLWSPGIDSKKLIPPAYVAWRAGTITLFLLGS